MTAGQYLLAFVCMGVQLFCLYLALFVLGSRKTGNKQEVRTGEH